jgi:hypothetical protein
VSLLVGGFADCERRAFEVSELPGAVKIGTVDDDMRVDMFLVRMGTAYKSVPSLRQFVIGEVVPDFVGRSRVSWKKNPVVFSLAIIKSSIQLFLMVKKENRLENHGSQTCSLYSALFSIKTGSARICPF